MAVEEGTNAVEGSEAQETITLRVREGGGEDMYFRIKKTTKMSKVFEAYCQRKGVQLDTVRFTRDGERINRDETPKMLELEDDDMIEASIQTVGGERCVQMLMCSNLIVDCLHRLASLTNVESEASLPFLTRLCKIVLAKQSMNRIPNARERSLILIILQSLMKSYFSGITSELCAFLNKVLSNIESAYDLCSNSHEHNFIIEVFSGLLSNEMLLDTALQCISNIHQRGDHPFLESRLRWICRKMISCDMHHLESKARLFNFLDVGAILQDGIELLRNCDILNSHNPFEMHNMISDSLDTIAHIFDQSKHVHSTELNGVMVSLVAVVCSDESLIGRSLTLTLSLLNVLMSQAIHDVSLWVIVSQVTDYFVQHFLNAKAADLSRLAIKAPCPMLCRLYRYIVDGRIVVNTTVLMIFSKRLLHRIHLYHVNTNAPLSPVSNHRRATTGYVIPTKQGPSASGASSIRSCDSSIGEVMSMDYNGTLNDFVNSDSRNSIVVLADMFVHLCTQEYDVTGWEKCHLKIFTQVVFESLSDTLHGSKRHTVPSFWSDFASKDIEFDTISIAKQQSVTLGQYLSEVLSALKRNKLSKLYEKLSGYCYICIIDVLSGLFQRQDQADLVCLLVELLIMITVSNVDIYFHATVEFLTTNFSRCIDVTTWNNLTVKNALIGTASGLRMLASALDDAEVISHYTDILVESTLRVFNTLAEECICEVVTFSQQMSIPVSFAMRGSNIPVFYLVYLLPAIEVGLMRMINRVTESIRITMPIWRAFWSHMALFRFEKRELWSGNKHLLRWAKENKSTLPDAFIELLTTDMWHHRGSDGWVLSSIKSIACVCPPLVDCKGGMTIGSLIHELTTPFTRRISSTLLGSYSKCVDWVCDCSGYSDLHVQSTFIRAHSEHERREITIGTAMFIAGVTLLESTRIQSDYNVRPMFKYMTDEAILTSHNIRLPLKSIFEVRILQLFCIALKNVDKRLESNSVAESIFSTIISEYLCGNVHVQEIATKWLRALLQNWPQLKFQPACVTRLLDACESVAFELLTGHIDEPQLNNMLPRSREAIRNMGYYLLKLTYECLTASCAQAPILSIAILEEYVIVRSSKHKSPRKQHIGIEIATEICTYGRPQVFVRSELSLSEPLSDLRRKAATEVFDSLCHEGIISKGKHLTESYCVTEAVALKSRYVGEVCGRFLTQGKIADGTDSFTRHGDSAVGAILSCGAVVRQLFLHTGCFSDAHVTQLLQSMSQSLITHFNQDTMITLLMMWRWLVVLCPLKYRRIIIIESLRAIMLTLHGHMGTFSTAAPLKTLLQTQEKHTMPQEIHLSDNDGRPHTACMIYLNEILSYFEDDTSITCLVSQLIDCILTDSIAISSCMAYLTPQFRILDIGTLLLKRFDSHNSMLITCHFSVDRRRVLRENMIATAFKWFSAFEFTYGNDSLFHEDINALFSFCNSLAADVSRWRLDYDEKKRKDFCCFGSRHLLRYVTRFLESGDSQSVSSRISMSEASKKFGIYISDTGGNRAVDNCITFLLLSFTLQVAEQLQLAATSDQLNISWFDKDKTSLSESELSALRTDYEDILKSMMFRDAIHAAWAIYPSLSLKFVEKFNKLVCGDSDNFMCQTVYRLIQASPTQIRMDWQGISGLMNNLSGKRRLTRRGVGSSDEDVPSSSKGRGSTLLRELLHWVPSPPTQAIDIMSRISVASLLPKQSTFKDEWKGSLFMNPFVIQYIIRSLRSLDAHTMQFYLPQLVQLLRRDFFGKLMDFLEELCVSSALLCHHLVWLLEVESIEEVADNHRKTQDQQNYGYCCQLKGADTLPALARELLCRIRGNLPSGALKYLHSECDYFNAVTSISAKLAEISDKDTHNLIIEQEVINLGLPLGLYLPTNPNMRVTSVDVSSGTPMQSAAKCPFLLIFNVEPWDGPDSLMNTASQFANDTESPIQLDVAQGLSISDEKSCDSEGGENMQLFSHDRVKIIKSCSKNIKSKGFVTPKEDSNLLHGEEVPTLSHSRPPALTAVASLRSIGDKSGHVAQRIAEAVKPGWTRLKNWEMRRMSRHGFPAGRHFQSNFIQYPKYKADIGEEACIFKVYDDCRQDSLTIQIIHLLRDAFKAYGLPLILVPYSVIPNRTGEKNAIGGILQVVPNVRSRDNIGKSGAKTLLQHFTSQYGNISTATFQEARQNFIHSLAGYAVVCYLLAIKDRHNGNILISDDGLIVHIDFGFLLGISPGGNLGFETAAFKLTNEMIEVIGGMASKEFEYFTTLVIQGFLAARDIMNPLLTIVASMADSGLPCFIHKDDNITKMRARFFPESTNSQAAALIRRIVLDAANKWSTVAYDGVQKLQNNIYSDVWK